MRGRSDEKKAGELLAYLEGEAFSFYYDTFSRDGVLLETARDYSQVKESLTENFSKEETPEELIHAAVSAGLKYDDMEGSLKDIDRAFEKAGCNKEAKFGLPRKTVMDHADLAQFAVLRGANYQDLKRVVKEFVNGRKALQSSRALHDEPLVQAPAVARAAKVSWNDNSSKKVLVRDSQRAVLEQKLDALADQLSHLTLLIKKNQGPDADRLQVSGRTCSYCHKTRHGAAQCEGNPHKNTICPHCRKKGHAEATCWMKKTPNLPRKVSLARFEPETEIKLASIAHREEEQATGNQVSVVTEINDESDEDLVAAAKRTAEGQAIPKQVKTSDERQVEPVSTKHRVYPTFIPNAPMLKNDVRVRGSTSKRRPNKKKASKAKKGLQEHTRKYHAISELVNASSGLTFGQLIRGNADDARKELRRLLGRGSRTRRALTASLGSLSRRLKVVTVRVYGTNANALLDSDAAPNLISASLTSTLGLQPRATARKIMVADGSRAICVGTLTNVPVSFGDLSVPISFLVVEGTPFDVIVGCPTLEMLQACIDLGRQHVKMTADGTTVKLGLEHDDARDLLTDSQTDSEDFMSGTEVLPGSSETSDDEDLVIAVLNQEPFEPDLNPNKNHNNDDDDDDDLTPLLDVESDSDEEDDDQEKSNWLQELRNSEDDDNIAAIVKKLSRPSSDVQEDICLCLFSCAVLAWPSDDISPANVPVVHSFELNDDKPIHSTARRLPPKYNEIVREELDKMLKAGVATTSSLPDGSEPKDLESYIIPFINELDNIFQRGGALLRFYDGSMRRVRIHLVWFTAYLVASKKVVDVVGHNGRCPCRYCNISGVYIAEKNHYYYPSKLCAEEIGMTETFFNN